MIGRLIFHGDSHFGSNVHTEEWVPTLPGISFEELISVTILLHHTGYYFITAFVRDEILHCSCMFHHVGCECRGGSGRRRRVRLREGDNVLNGFDTIMAHDLTIFRIEYMIVEFIK